MCVRSVALPLVGRVWLLPQTRWVKPQRAPQVHQQAKNEVCSPRPPCTYFACVDCWSQAAAENSHVCAFPGICCISQRERERRNWQIFIASALSHLMSCWDLGPGGCSGGQDIENSLSVVHMCCCTLAALPKPHLFLDTPMPTKTLFKDSRTLFCGVGTALSPKKDPKNF